MPGLVVLVGIVLTVAGCAEVSGQKVAPLPGDAVVARRMQLWKTTGQPTTGPARTAATRPADPSSPLTEPYRINIQSIVRLLYEKSPLVISEREEMIAARHGLDEFRANLSRFEPFVRATSDAMKFPKRRDSEGLQGEVVGGVEKETFEGAVLRVESGVSASRFEFGEVDEDAESLEKGSGTVIRARIEVPFAGSRKRQNRIISQAFQESSARKAMLDYLSGYRTYTISTFLYHRQTILYLRYMQAYERKLTEIEALLEDPDLKPEDRRRLETTQGETIGYRDIYRAYHWSSRLSLLQYLGIKPDEEYILEEVTEPPTRYLEQVRTREGLQQLLADALENNPRFQVLADAIENAELQRSQAILGTHDITAFVEGRQFPFGAETFDDRVGGWQISAGLTVRPNDKRVLTASREKAEAEIRQFRAEIEAERLSIHRQIASWSDRLLSYYRSRSQILDNLAKSKREYEERRDKFFNGQSSQLTIDDVLNSLSSITRDEIRLAGNLSYLMDAETDLMTATGDVYRLVGIKIQNNGNGTELSENNGPETDAAIQ